MPRVARMSAGDTIYHCMNRSNGRIKIFNNDKDYQFFEYLLEEGKDLIGMRILSYVVMPNHWHMLLYPVNDGDLGKFLHWVTTSHVRYHRTKTKTIGHGHLYQGTYKSFPVETGRYAETLFWYIERNPLKAGLVDKAEKWKWSSLWRREFGTEKQKKLLSDTVVELPDDYLDTINLYEDKKEIEKIEKSIKKGTPIGSVEWIDEVAVKYNIEHTLRKRGRPFGS